ncbi:MAG: helix-turn-helix domain-containing protein [Cyclobacteriaceae bacterium]
MILGLTIISIGIFNGLMLSFVFLNRRMPHPYMGLFILAHCVVLGKFLLYFLPFNKHLEILRVPGELISWTIAPLLYFYVKRYLNKQFSLPTHLILILILLALDLIFRSLPIEDNQQAIAFSSARVIQGLIYLLLMFEDIRRNRWLKVIVFLYLLELISILANQTITNESYFAHLLIPVSIMLIIGFITLESILNSTFVVEASTKRKLHDPSANRETFEKIQRTFKETELYLNPNLKLADLAKELGISEKIISQAINECSGENVNLFINRYRIKTAERLLIEQSRHITIDGIAELSGFSNKVSFYKAFRKVHAISPKEYIEVKTTQA